MEAEYYRELLRPVVAGRKWVLAGIPVAAWTRTVATLRGLGAPRCLIIGSSLGTGDLPHEEDADWFDLQVQATSMMDGFRETERLLRQLPPDARRVLDEYDPEGSALALGTPFLPEPTLGGRPVYGYRRPEWLALEDKAVVDGFWERARVERPPSRVVEAAGEHLRRAAAMLDGGEGTVWQGDAHEGFNGGAEYLRWVRDEVQAAEASAYFEPRCRRVRVTPFLEGIPCSIHGMVLPEVVVVFRPVEIVTLRQVGTARLRYAGTASFWDPPEEDRRSMRALARVVGEALRREVAYRGAFTVDGVMTPRGFLPTELNTRAGAGLASVFRSLPEVPLGLLNAALIEGEPLELFPDRLETMVLERADAGRGGGGHTAVSGRRRETQRASLVEDEDGYRLAGEGEEPDAQLELGPSDVGGLVRFTPEPDRIAAGPSIAGRVVSAFALADDLWGTAIGKLEPAREVRGAGSGVSG